jgi:hypothetical protein
MTLTSIEAVRLKSSDKSTITRDVTTADGVSAIFKMQQSPLLVTPAPLVRKNTTLLTVTTDYTVDHTNGLITFGSLPTVNDELDFTYYWSIFTDDEIQYFIDEASGDVSLATARLLLAWAADAAKVAKRQTLSGGGGLGQVVIDTSVVAKELRATAKALIDTNLQIAENTPAEGFTTIPWTEAIYEREVFQHIISEN